MLRSIALVLLLASCGWQYQGIKPVGGGEVDKHAIAAPALSYNAWGGVKATWSFWWPWDAPCLSG